MTLHGTDDVKSWATDEIDRYQNDPEYGDDTYDGAWLDGAVYTLKRLLDALDEPESTR